MKKNGFIATSLIYSFFLVFIAVIVALVGNYISNKTILSRFNQDILDKLNGTTVVQPDNTPGTDVSGGTNDDEETYYMELCYSELDDFEFDDARWKTLSVNEYESLSVNMDYLPRSDYTSYDILCIDNSDFDYGEENTHVEACAIADLDTASLCDSPNSCPIVNISTDTLYIDIEFAGKNISSNYIYCQILFE